MKKKLTISIFLYFILITSGMSQLGLNVENDARISGKLGIGTATPQTSFHVKSIQPELARFENSSTTASSNWIGFYDGDTRRGMVWKRSNDMALLSDIGNIDFYANGFSNTPDMRIATNGNVGIGTVNPEKELHIFKNTTNNGGIRIENANHRMDIFSGATASGLSATGGILQFVLGGSERLRIDANGNVGIGTAAFSSRLVVEDDKDDSYLYTVIKNTGNGGSGLWLLNENNTTGSSKVIMRNAQGTTARYWAIGNDRTDGNKFKIAAASIIEGQSQFVIDRNGNVGIGTTNPSNKLHIQGGKLILGEDNQRFNIDLRVDGKVAFEANGTDGDNTFVIDDDGIRGVGIGTDNPEQKLHVLGNVRLEGDVFFGSIEALLDGGANQIATNSTFRPTVDNSRDLGTSANRWNEVWAADGSINTSDARLKNKIKKLKYGLEDVLKLRPVSFTWKQKGYENKLRLGFLAQDLQKVLPEVVRTENYEIDLRTGEAKWEAVENLGVAYSEIIPVMVAAIQEQQATIETKEERITNLEKENQSLNDRLTQLESTVEKLLNVPSDNEQSGIVNPRPFLQQNQPNPFSENTQIQYSVPESAQTAQLQITTTNGKVLKTFALKKGKSSINIDARQLAAGSYFYTLIIDGQAVESKQMILTDY